MTGSGMQTPDNLYAFDSAFDYSVWAQNASVVLGNVPWDSSYRDVTRFTTQAEKKTYFDQFAANGTHTRVEHMTYLKYGEPVLLNVPFSVANGYNYLVVTNGQLPVPGELPNARRTFYYFITGVEYLAPNTTRINVQLDVWQTYGDNVQFNQCFIERGHIGIANENVTNDTIADYLTIPEGLEIGGEYATQDQFFYNLLDESPMVVVMTTADLTADFGTIDAPNLKTATGGIYDGLPNGANIYAFDGENFQSLMSDELSNAPWVAQCITMLTVIPRRFLELNESVSVGNAVGYALAGSETVNEAEIKIDEFHARFNLPARYAHLKKFLTFPYSAIEMTTLSGGEIVLKPELFDWFNPLEPDTAVFKMLSCVSPPHIRVYFYPRFYNGSNDASVFVQYKKIDGGQSSVMIDGGEFLNMAVQIGNFPQFSLVNNAYMQVLAATAHTRDYQFASADWSQTKATTGAALAFDQATFSNNTIGAQNVANVKAMNARTRIANVQALTSVVNGGASGAAGGVAGMAAGAAAGGAGAVAQIAANNATNNVNVNLANTSTQITRDQGFFNRDTNYEYAQFAAKGDYENAIQAINARVQDAKLTQPSTAGQNGGEAFNLSNGLWGVLFKFKRIRDQYVRTVGEFWLRFGYYVNLFLVPPADLHCMSRFTYWKMHEVHLTAPDVPEQHREAIRGIFEKGVTVWRVPDEIGRVDLADNLPAEGVSY